MLTCWRQTTSAGAPCPICSTTGSFPLLQHIMAAAPLPDADKHALPHQPIEIGRGRLARHARELLVLGVRDPARPARVSYRPRLPFAHPEQRERIDRQPIAPQRDDERALALLETWLGQARTGRARSSFDVSGQAERLGEERIMGNRSVVLAPTPAPVRPPLRHAHRRLQRESDCSTEGKTIMSSVPPAFAMSYSKAWSEHDPDAIVAMHTDDTVFHMHGYAEAATGRVAVRAAIAALFDQSPDLHFRPRRVHLGEDHFVSEYEVSGTASGKPFACEGVDVFTLRDGRIARKDTYIDWLAYQRQMGIDSAAKAS